MDSKDITGKINNLSPKAKQLLLVKLNALEQVKKASSSSKNKRIVAYIEGDTEFSLETLKTGLKNNLPDYMIPSQFVTVNSMPLLPNGKIDRQALQKETVVTKINKGEDTTNTPEPNNDIELSLIRIWQEVLGISPISKHDNFFEIGGDSILSIQIVAKAKQQNIDLKSNDIFEHQTIEALAGFAKKENAPNVSISEKLIAIWEETLGFSPITVNDNFFEIGGDSILSIQIVAKAKQQSITIEANHIFEHQTINELVQFTKDENKSESNIEEKLITIWEDVLGFAPITTTDNFFEIGGDSILSIQILAKAKQQGIILNANHIFEHQTIGELALFAEHDNVNAHKNNVSGKINLTPIQNWFFEEHLNAPHFWNQGVTLKNLPTLTEDDVKTLCKSLLMKHDALRSKFYIEDGKWMQDIAKEANTKPYRYFDTSQVHPNDLQEFINKNIEKEQQNFELNKGNLFICLYFYNAVTQNNFSVIIAHHLVVDAVSWQIIIDDFQTIVKQLYNSESSFHLIHTNSLKDWDQYLENYANSKVLEELPFWEHQITPTNRISSKTTNNTVILEEDIIVLKQVLKASDTKQLIKANTAFNTKTDELLVAAFINALATWQTINAIQIGFERHGRETAGTSLDLSQTVGWFTAYFPLRFDVDTALDVKHQIINTKEILRAIPNGGVGFGVLKYMNKVLKDAEYPEVLFNFLGTKNTLSHNNAIEVTPLESGLRDPKSERRYVLELNLSIIDEQLHISTSYSKHSFNTEDITVLNTSFLDAITKITAYCNAQETGSYTPSDFTETDISQDDLDSLLDALE